MDVVQIFLTIFSLLSLVLVTSELESRRDMAPFFGLASQPFWLYTAYITEANGVLFMSIAYTLIWIKGIYNVLNRRLRSKNKDDSR